MGTDWNWLADARTTASETEGVAALRAVLDTLGYGWPDERRQMAIGMHRAGVRAGAPGRAAPEPDIPNRVDAAADRAVAALDGLTKAQQRDALALIEHWIALDRRAAFTVRAGDAPPEGQP